MLQSLYEDWCQSGEDWHVSATYMRTQETKSSKKRGRMCYRSFKELVEKFGQAVAKQIRDCKYEMEKKRAPHEQPLWLPHPEIKDNKDGLAASLQLFVSWAYLLHVAGLGALPRL